MSTGESLGGGAACEQALLRVGGRLRRWEARLVLCRGAAAVGAWWVVAGFLDLFVAVDRPARFVSFVLWLGAALAVGWLVLRILKRRYSPEGVAAEVERAFPEMDNRLINYIQFARDAARDVFKAAYVADGAPPWQELELAEMKDRPAHRKSGWALAAVVALLLLPAAFFGSAWPTAVWRMINPFSAAEPVTLTRIVQVTPGDHVILRGEAILLQCDVQGFAGHEVRVEVHPADSDKTTYALGSIESDGVEEFARRIPRATTDLKYRFRAGDAQPSDWYTVKVQSPPALTGLLIAVTPPAIPAAPQAPSPQSWVAGRVLPEYSTARKTLSHSPTLLSASTCLLCLLRWCLPRILLRP